MIDPVVIAQNCSSIKKKKLNSYIIHAPKHIPTNSVILKPIEISNIAIIHYPVREK